MEIDLAAIASNMAEIRRITSPTTGVMAVVKANGYGHGAIEVSRAVLAGGADWLGVARIDEGLLLRKRVLRPHFGTGLPDARGNQLMWSEVVYPRQFTAVLWL